MVDQSHVIADLQTKLNSLGYGPLKVDNQYGKATEVAYKAYLASQGNNMPVVAPASEVPWYCSRAMLGILSMIMTTFLGFFGWYIDSSSLTNVLYLVATLGGSVIALVGTVKRKGRIDKTAILPGIKLDKPLFSNNAYSSDESKVDASGAANYDER